MCADAYATFAHPAVAPLVQIGDEHFVQELFHGPTLAFKDVALQLVGRMFEHVLSRAGSPRHDRRRDVGRHGLCGDRRCAALRSRRHRHPLSRWSHQRCAAPADDHRRRAERACRCHRRLLRRLSRSRQGDVQRCSVSRPNEPERGELDQLGAGHGPGRVLRHGHGSSPRRGQLLRAEWQLRQCVLRLDRQEDRCADRSVVGRLECQRHPHPLLQRQRDAHSPGRAVAESLDGHPGVVELRAAAVRDQRPRRGPDHRTAPTIPGQRIARRSRPTSVRSTSTACSSPPASTTPRHST